MVCLFCRTKKHSALDILIPFQQQSNKNITASTVTPTTRLRTMPEVQSPIPTTINVSTPLSSSVQGRTTPSSAEDEQELPDDPHSSQRLWERLHAEALEALEDEPELRMLLNRTVLAPGVSSFEEAVAMTVCFRLLQTPCNNKPPQPQQAPVFCPNSLFDIFKTALLNPNDKELDHCMSDAVRKDVMAVLDRDPACDTLLEVVLFMKGFAALVCHRAARQKWIQALARGKSRSLTALFLQSLASAVFGVDIHPAATIGAGILLDHGTGIVIGETARVGDGCTLLHEVTLGGTGKDHGDRHPKIGPRVLIGAGAKILGNIHVGAGAKIGAGSIVLQSIPAGATAVGAPAKIIGRALEADPARDRDENLDNVKFLHKSASTVSTATTRQPSSIGSDSSSKTHQDDNDDEEDSSTEEEFLATAVATAKKLGNETAAEETAPKTKEEEPSTGPFLPPLKQPQDKTLPHRHHHSSSTRRNGEGNNNEDCCNPFREYVRMSFMAPAGTLTIVGLKKALLLEGCTPDEIGSTFFELDTRNVGHVHWKVAKKCLAKSLANNTRLTPERIDFVVAYLERQYECPTSRRSLTVG